MEPEPEIKPESIEQLKQAVIELIRKMGYFDPLVEYQAEKKRLSVVITDPGGKPITVRMELQDALEHIIKQFAAKLGVLPIYVDINNYRANREKLIVELAKAAARKANATKGTVELPPMNAYERRLVHVELSTRPDVQTESAGEGMGRHVVVKPFE